MVYKIENRFAVFLGYLSILALVIWFGLNRNQPLPTRATQIKQILKEMQTRKAAAKHTQTVPQEGTCSICFEQAPYWLPCGHYFHLNCIEQWLHTAMSCPNCRCHPIR
ncbi:RING finger domain-containing protein [Cardinium endosymbiont of Nabis limbatus]|uniref:RING finger domain-containing protein n=1 Tax=Cardinium endosymbiont of Nabis limbatus TaxID=3066217 RepID=UPI003AF388C9